MSTSLQDKVELFLSNTDFIAFTINTSRPSIHLMFRKEKYLYMEDEEKFKELRRYFKGKRMRLLIVGAFENSHISFIDTISGDTLNIKGPKFISNNIDKFIDSKISTETVFSLG